MRAGSVLFTMKRKAAASGAQDASGIMTELHRTARKQSTSSSRRARDSRLFRFIVEDIREPDTESRRKRTGKETRARIHGPEQPTMSNAHDAGCTHFFRSTGRTERDVPSSMTAIR